MEKTINKEEYLRLLKELKNKNFLIEQLMEEKEKSDYLDFSWTGNLGHWYWNVKTNDVQFNPLKIQALGYQSEELPEKITYKYFTDKLHPDDFDMVMQNMRNHLSGKTDVYETEYRIKAKNGEWKWFYDRGKITKRDNEGKPILLVGIVFDITEKKNAEIRMQELVTKLGEEINLKEKLFSIIVHDLKNPLSNIMNFAELLKEQLPKTSPEGISEKIAYIEMLAKEAADQISNLNHWMRSTVSDQVDMSYFEPYEVIVKLKKEFSDNFIKKNIQLQNLIHKELVIFSSKEIVTIVLRNLISNAIKFSIENSNIEIFAEKSSDNVSITVKDFGAGIQNTTLQKLFKSHVTPNIGTNNEVGQGMGLMICSSLARKINGDLSAQSEIGEGTSISLLLNNAIKEY